jgi:biotin carboxylase
MIPSEYDPNLALALVWGETIDEAKQRAAQFIKKVSIKGKDSHGNKIITNLDYLKNNLDRLLTF